jgi:hypothetical protein
MGANCIPFTSTNGKTRKAGRPSACRRKISTERGAKSKPLRVPIGKVVQAKALLVQGHSQREIGRELHISPMTVAKIIKAEDFQSFIKEMHERLFAIAPIAIESFHAQVQSDGYLAFAFLKSIGIIPSPEAIAQFLNTAAPQTENGEERQARMLAAVLLEGRKNYGVELPEGFDTAVARDSQESQDEESAQPKLLRK